MSDEARINISIAKKGKSLSETQKNALNESRMKRFKELFNKHLSNWILNPDSEKQWRYDMSRKRKDNTLQKEYINILESINNWSWSSKD